MCIYIYIYFFFLYSKFRNIEREGDIYTQGFTFQTCLKNLITCMQGPKTRKVELSEVGGQLWFL